MGGAGGPPQGREVNARRSIFDQFSVICLTVAVYGDRYTSCSVLCTQNDYMPTVTAAWLEAAVKGVHSPPSGDALPKQYSSLCPLPSLSSFPSSSYFFIFTFSYLPVPLGCACIYLPCKIGLSKGQS